MVNIIRTIIIQVITSLPICHYRIFCLLTHLNPSTHKRENIRMAGSATGKGRSSLRISKWEWSHPFCFSKLSLLGNVFVSTKLRIYITFNWNRIFLL